MGRRFTISDLKKLPNKMVPTELIESLETGKPEEKKMRGKAKSTEPEEKGELGMTIYAICQNGGIAFQREYRFHSARRYKFDWALPELKIAIEYEGLNSDKSGHSTLVGYTKNCEKYNLALRCGWRVLRYTVINYKNAGIDLLELIKNSNG